jgi:hypothetical protein
MGNVDWRVEGMSYGSCNCDYGCPCQFESKPTHGHCRGFEVAEIERGHFGEVRLDGLRFAIIYAWPGPIYEGGGEMQAIVDERATPAQREALTTVLYGGETDEAATHWWVFHAMSKTVHPPIYAPIKLSTDMQARVAEASVPGIFTSRAGPIRSPVTGEPHRVRIDLPDGIEFQLAEIGSGVSTAKGAILLDLKETYAQFNRLKHSGRGLDRAR